MASPNTRLPKYRHYRPKDLAVVRIDGRDHYLGKHDSPESHAKYRRLVAEWLTSNRVTDATAPSPDCPSEVSVDEVLAAFWKHAEVHYRGRDGLPSRELDNLRDALRPLRRLYGLTPARLFGPLALCSVRDEMVRGGLARTTVNARVNRIRRAFRWAASVELLPAAMVQALETVDGLSAGRSDAREAPGIAAVSGEHVERVLPFLPGAVAAMVRLQLLTGCRAGEVMRMRGGEIAIEDSVWEYKPVDHKNAWRGQRRVIPLGPKARSIVESFRRPDPSDYLFSPRDVVAEHHLRRTQARASKPTPSELRMRCGGLPGMARRSCYDRRTYRQAIVRACTKAGVPAWSPLQLRHTAATAIRARYGLEAAQAVLGHSKADTTLIYAERDIARAREVMAEIG
jgi:integrase